MDGCPVVRVSDPSADISHLLSVLCCGKNYYYDGDTLIAVPFDVLASLIRMAHKYAVQDVLDHALSRLKKYYTNDFSAWQNPDARARYVTAVSQDAPVTIELARLTNTPLLLPCALLACIGLVESYSVGKDGDPVYSHVANLSVLNQVRLVRAKEFLTQACATRVLHLVAAVPCASCTSHRKCAALKEALLDAFRESEDVYGLRVRYISGEHALKPLAKEVWHGDGWERICEGCREALAKIDAKGMKALWLTLPSVFKVEIDKDVW